MSNGFPRIYRAITCNFCHRVEIALHAKGVAFEAVDVDLVDRPGWYRAKASKGSVPLLEVDGLALHPSTVINEYLEERWPEPPLLPEALGERAAAREWIEWWNDAPCPAYERRLMNVRPERDAALTEVLLDGLRALEARLAARGYAGAYWGGKDLGLVDATAAPMFVRFAGLRHFHGIDVPDELGRVRAWREALLADPHVRATSPEEGALLSEYERYRGVLAKAAAAGVHVRVARGD